MITDMLDLEQLLAQLEAKAASAPQAHYETMSERDDEHTLADEQSGGHSIITDIHDLEQLLAESEAKAAAASQVDYEAMSERGDEHTLADEQSGGVAHELLEHHQSTRRVNQASPADGASVAQEQRLITLNQGGQLAAEPAAAPQRTKVTGQESAKSRHQTDLTFEGQFRQLAGTLFDDDSGKLADTMAEFQGSARLSLNHAPTKGAGRNDANDNGPSRDANHTTGNLTREPFQDTGRDEAGAIRLPPAATLSPLTKVCGEAPARQNQQHLELSQDDIASANLKLAAPAQPDNCPISPVEPCRSLPESLTLTRLDSVPILPIKRTRGRSAFLLLGIALFSTFVLPNTRKGVDKVDNTQLTQVTNSPSKSGAAEPPSPMSQPANAIGSEQQAEAAPRTVPPAAAASRRESSSSDAALVSDRHEPGAHQERTADLSEAKAIAKRVKRGMETLKSGDLESARGSPRRAVEAIPGTAAVPSQVEPSRSMPLPGTSQALAVEPPGPQNAHSPQIKSSSDAGYSAQVARLEPEVTPGSGQVAPGQKRSTIRRLDPDEIAILLSRGMDFLKSEDFASARVTLRRAAEAGNAEAALALGTTYDPSVLRQLGAVGIVADVAEAREWYEKAMKFGSAAAAQRLGRLAQPAR